MKSMWQWVRRSQLPPQMRPKPLPRLRRRSASKRTVFLAAIAILLLTGAIGYRYYNEPQLMVATMAPQTIYAPRTALVEDRLATESARKAARQTAVNVFTISKPLTTSIEADLTDLLTQAQALRKLAGRLPFISTAQLSTEVQRTLRQLDRSQLEALLTAAAQPRSAQNIPAKTQTTPQLKKAWSELKANHDASINRSGPQRWDSLAQQLRLANTQYQFAQRSTTGSLATIQVESILNLTDPEWQPVQKKIRSVLKRMLSQGMAPGLLPEVTHHAVVAQISDWPPLQQKVALQVLPTVLRSNLVLDPGASFRQQEQAAQGIRPVMVQIRKGDVIVRESQSITSSNFALLDHFGLSRRQPNWGTLLLILMAVSIAIAAFVLIRRRTRRRWTERDDILVLLLALSAPLMISLTEVTYTTLPAVGLLIGSFYGPILGAATVVLLNGLIPLGLQTGGQTFAAIAVGSLVGAVMAGYVRSREEFARVGIVLGLVQSAVYAIIVSGTSNIIDTVGILGAAVRQGVIGVGWCILVLGVSPYLEKVFDLITPIRLAELANPNRPLLKQLAEQAPGTFQHTLFVTTLAESGARALKANVELVRTGTLYHDIGKLHDPQAFIENQFGGPNKHTELNDPWQSADIIRRHVSEGLVMARKAGLPAAVQAFIPEHQGTMLIAYFYHQACQMAEQTEPSEQATQNLTLEKDFRYIGPTPQSRETGIVMLADSCEAALRSMKQIDPVAGLRTIQQIFKTRWQDQQLVDSQLTRDELDVLAQVFVEVWQQVNHQRIAYPQPLSALPLSQRRTKPPGLPHQ